MQQAAVAVVATNRANPHPTPINTVETCHQQVGMDQKLGRQHNFTITNRKKEQKWHTGSDVPVITTAFLNNFDDPFGGQTREITPPE